MLEWKKPELFFVMGTILVIFVISFVQLRESQMKTRDAQRKADVGLIGRALNQYLADHEVLPEEQNGMIVGCGDMGISICRPGEQIQDDKGIVYLKSVPQDPLDYKGYRYIYERDLNGRNFRLYIALEFKRDPERRIDLTMMCGTGVQCNWYEKF